MSGFWSCHAATSAPSSRHTVISSFPLIRAIVVNHNGGDRTFRCLECLSQTEWPADRIELVVVDNASTDGLIDRVTGELSNVKVIRSDQNIGFGAGNNVALRGRDGAEFVALINPDAFVTPNWLRPLVDTLRTDPALGAACPKIVLTGRYAPVSLESDSRRRGRGDRRSLGVRVSGLRVDGQDVSSRTRFASGTWGRETGGRWTDGAALLQVPVDASQRRRVASIRLDAEVPTTVSLPGGPGTTEHRIVETPSWYEFRLSSAGAVLLNNVGTDLVNDGYGADRGWLEPDMGQFDQPEDVFAWCGAAVLLRGAYLDDIGLFDERFFLYYEDLELAWRGQRRGWRYRTAPASVVAHDHSTSTIEGSKLFDHLNERNHLLAVTRHGTPSLNVRAWTHHLFITASYARRDILSPSLRRERSDSKFVRRRLRAFGSAMRLAPAMLRSRANDARRQRTPRAV